MRWTVRLTLLLTLTTAVVTPCSGQTRIEVTPLMGAYLASGPFESFNFSYPEPDLCMPGGSATQEIAAFGGAEIAAMFGKRVGVQLGVGYAPSQIDVEGSYPQGELFCPAGQPYMSRTSATVTMWTAQALWALTSPSANHPSWYLLAGGGFVRHDGTPGRIDWGPALGIGVRMPTHMVTPRAELQVVNLLASSQNGTQGHVDFVVSAGLSMCLWKCAASPGPAR